jgi:hypothetical protein
LPFTAFMSNCKNNIFIHHVPLSLSLSLYTHTHTHTQSQASPLLSCHSCNYDIFTGWCPNGYRGNWHAQVSLYITLPVHSNTHISTLTYG